MAWTTEIADSAVKTLRKIDPHTRRRIWATVRQIAELEDPRSRGKGLTGNLRGLWRYRVGDWRIICDIDDGRLTIIVIEVGHRSRIYD